jgi:hypothetical protein
MDNDFITDYWNILIEKLQELEVEFKNSENEDFIKGKSCLSITRQASSEIN